MLDMSGGTTNAALYLDTAHSITGAYPLPLPWSQSQLNQTAITDMREMMAIGSYENATATPDNQYQRGIWFSDGWGRAVMGYTESMSQMSAQTLSGIGFKVMPLSDTHNPPLFYADVIGVNTSTNQRSTRALAVQLANVMASSVTMVDSIGPDPTHPIPQYLMATRPSVFQTLWQGYPLYMKMYGLITSTNPIMFKVNDQVRTWLTAMKAPITADARKNYPCGCDFPAGQYIPDNQSAPPVCQAACSAHGGWTGQWTNKYPAAPVGTAVCGCKACPMN
jgi:thiamine pyridinylase